MENIEIEFSDKVHGKVTVYSDRIEAGFMSLAMTGGRLAVFHTEVFQEFEGRGFAKLLLAKLVSYAREQQYKIIPLCPYVNAQFTRHPEEYDDVWYKDWHH